MPVRKIKLSVIILLLFIFISIIFNFSLWKELFINKITIGDNISSELVFEASYQNILHFRNPFITNLILYPFTINYSLGDPGTANVVFFFLLRPFFNPHQSLLLITLMSFLLNNLFMYLVLRRLKINQYISVLISLIFGFTPFLSHRVLGHYTYIPIYFFPLIFLIISEFLKSNKNKNKIILSAIFGLSLGLVILSNFYYFFMILLAIISLIVYWFFQDRIVFFKIIWRNIRYMFLSFVVFTLIIIPWVLSVYQLIKSEGLVNTPGFGGAVELSADVFSFLTPSEYNPIYKTMFSKIVTILPAFSKYNNFFLDRWERFVYPGIIIVLIYCLIIFLKIVKKFPLALWDNIKPYFITSLFFAVLMLGPFLKIFNHWTVNLDGVAVVFPLPFLMLHYIPGLSTIRASSRFAPIFVFFACLITAYAIDFVFKKINKKKQIIILISLFLIFFIDQLYVIPTKFNREIPNNIYLFLKNRPQGTVLEIPFTVRDGFNYIGFVHAIQPMAGQPIHGKPIIGGYTARVPSYIFDYYKKLPFIGHVAIIIDKGNYNPFKEKPKEVKVVSFDGSVEEAKKELNFLDVKYLILKNDEKYSAPIVGMLPDFGFVRKMRDGDYDLYEREIKKQDFINLRFGDKEDYLYAASGFSIRENGFRWTEGKMAKVFVKSYDADKKVMIFSASSFYEPQEVKVYLNENYLGAKKISVNDEKYSFDITNKLEPGINTFSFRFSKSFEPAKVLTDNKDDRNLSVKFNSLEIE